MPPLQFASTPRDEDLACHANATRSPPFRRATNALEGDWKFWTKKVRYCT